ncbi:MAG: hypothetical protein SFV22_02115 [Saprospiraceae bacterium]|nr:hypothetical protein [Saprospiraceae bacterium]
MNPRRSKIWTFAAILCLLIAADSRAQAFSGQTDAPQALQWAARQGLRADSLLHDAVRGSEAVEIFTRLAECYQIFDAVAMAGFYCTEVRAAAESGRRQCDVINYLLGKDLNSKVERVVAARRQANRLREAALACLQTAKPVADASEKAPFTLPDIIRQDAYLAELDLADGLASEDLHIVSQKIEHAIRLLHDVEHLARTFDSCSKVLQISNAAILRCESALAAPNWLELRQAVQEAISEVKKIQTTACF